MKVVTVLGARPQFVKASVVSAALRQSPHREYVVHTGQHFDATMSAVFFEELEMSPPDQHLGIHGGGHGEMTGRMLVELEKVLVQIRPDAVVVYGDTNSTLAGALAATKLGIPVAHIEAGLRSFNRAMPEETNRVLTDHMSTWLFAPTDEAVLHLRREGIGSASISQVGDVMFDVALHHGRRAESQRRGALEALGLVEKQYALVTVHRAENTDSAQRLRAIVDGLRLVAERMPVVWPVHPRTRAALKASGAWRHLAGHLTLLEPQGYLDMVMLERSAAIIATDSGGVQKEAFFHGVPCVTLRTETEWVELVELGWNRLAPPIEAESVCKAVLGAVGSVGRDAQPYGDGQAAKRIVAQLG